MNWDTGHWDEGFWDSPPPDSTYFHPRQTPKQTKAKTMSKQHFYPSRIADQANWHANFSAKLPTYGTPLGVDAGDVTSAVNDSKFAHYVLGDWLTNVRDFAPSTTDAVDDVLNGTGSDPVLLPTFVPSPLPAGVTAPPPGVLTRLFTLIATMKLSGNYTVAIGTDLGIEGEEQAEKATPKFTLALEQAQGHQVVRLRFFKYGHQGVHMETRRGTGTWEFLAIDTESPYLDERPLLAAGTPEVREYRMRFWDKGTPNGDWTEVLSITVSP